MLASQQRPNTIEAGYILPIAFTWQTSQPIPINYTVFIQLIDINGALVAQHDGTPQGGYLPTTTWQADNPIVDRHGLALPKDLGAGDYRLIAGLYDPTTGQRLLTTTGADIAELGIVTVLR